MSDTLKAIQERFAAGLLDPQSKDILFDLKSRPSLGADAKADRFSIYRGNLLAIWNKALANAFPVVRRLVGDDFFEELARAYGRAHPSSSGDLNMFGESFSAFLSQQESLRNYPYIAPVADLEWAIHRCYYVEDQEKISLPEFISTAGEHVQQSRLHFAQEVNFHYSDFATKAIWQAHQGSEVDELSIPLETATHCIVCRPQWQPQILELSSVSYRALSLLKAGESLEAALDLALQMQTDFDVGGQLQIWFAAGLFVGHDCKE